MYMWWTCDGELLWFAHCSNYKSIELDTAVVLLSKETQVSLTHTPEDIMTHYTSNTASSFVRL